jgi:hypothetical protein
MADRKQFMEIRAADVELLRLLDEAKHVPITEELLREQRISFAYGNALGSESVTKERVRRAARHLDFVA